VTFPVLERVGTLYGDERWPILLERGAPLSRAWVRRRDGPVPAARALAEARAENFTRRVPVRIGGPLEDASAALAETLVSPVFPAFGSLAFLDSEQVAVLGPGVRPVEDDVVVGAIRMAPVYELDPDPGRAPGPFARYWGSRWTYTDDRQEAGGWWRVWPQGLRQDIRGDFVAALSPFQWDALSRPHYVVVTHPSDAGLSLYAKVIVDTPEQPLAKPQYHRQRIVALDASCRDALGISDGDFCRLSVWRAAHRYRRFRQRAVGARTIVAHTKIAARVDLDKPVCRLSTDALAAIGVREDDQVVVESVASTGAGIEARRIRRRALSIDVREAEARAAWERRRGSDGWVDPAALHAIHPPYPAIYLDHFARERLGVPLGAPVIVRADVVARVTTDATVPIAVGSIVVATLTAVGVPAWVVVAVVGGLLVLLALLRARRSLGQIR
jgi:hypothetical protein